MDEITEPVDKERIGTVLWRGKYIILAAIVLMVALSLVYVETTAKVYQATAILQVNVATSDPGSVDETDADQGLAANYATLIVSPGLLGSIRKHVDGGRLSTGDLQAKLTATAIPSTALVQLTANGPSPQAAQQLGQQVVNGFLANLQSTAASRTTQLQSVDAGEITSLSKQISTLQASGPTAAVTQQITSLQASRRALISQNEALVASGLAQGTSATLSSPPVAGSDPISPRKSLDVVAALLLGSILGIALVWLRHRLRPALRSAEEATTTVNLPVLASIPLKSPLRADEPTVAEAYRILSANLSFVMSEDYVRFVTIVGFNPQVGKTSVAIGLAEATAHSDTKVLLVDGDMRAATLSKRLGYETHPGVVDVLQGTTDVDSALVQLSSELWLLPARASQINPASLLSGDNMAVLTAKLRRRFDLVVFDSPPIAGLADALLLASASDVAVLVVRAGLTKPSDLTSAASSLAQTNTPTAGMVVFESSDVKPYPSAPAPESEKREKSSDKDKAEAHEGIESPDPVSSGPPVVRGSARRARGAAS